MAGEIFSIKANIVARHVIGNRLQCGFLLDRLNAVSVFSLLWISVTPCFINNKELF